MKLLRQLGLILISLFALAAPSTYAAAETPSDYVPTPPLPAVYITAVQFSETLDYVELHNDAATGIDLRGWHVRYGYDLKEPGQYCDVMIDRYLAPGDYGLLASATAVVPDEQVLPLPACSWTGGALTTVALLDADFAEQSIITEVTSATLAAPKPWVRKTETTAYSSTALTDVFRPYPVTNSQYHTEAQIWTGGWYMPRAHDPRLRIIEVVANPRGCGPTETTLDCADYIKLHVGDMSFAELAWYAARTDSGGRARTSSNGANLADYPVTTEGYITVPISATNSGGYSWIEDVYGAVRHEASIVAYPDAGAESKRGYAWALGADGAWQWTSTPRPDAPNNIYLPPEPIKISTASTTLTPCREGQERNPDTNRCRSIVDAIASLVPCREGQERNPDTNRCRSVLAANSGLVPCKEGQERNPETNRCRKITLTSDDIPAVTDVPSDTQASRTGWIIASIVVAGAIAYAIYEWRGDIRRKLLRRK